MRQTLAAFGLFAIAAGAAAPAGAQTLSFAGTWKLNTQESDNPREKLQAATAAAPQGADGMTRGVRVGSVAGGGGGASGGGGGSLSGPDFTRVMRPAPQIAVEQNDTIIIIRDDQGLPLVYYLDGRKVEEPMPGAEPKVITAKLGKDGKLTVEKKLGGLGSMKEVFALEPEKRRLVVEAKLTSPTLGKTVAIRRVYDSSTEVQK